MSTGNLVFSYIPERGDVISVNFDPQAGHEQAKTRPALVLSPLEYNKKLGLALCCPITTKSKPYTFGWEVPIPPNLKVTGVILSDQIKSLDWKARNASFICTLPSEVVTEVLARSYTLLE